VDRWCSERQIAKGVVVPLDKVWALARLWYADRLDDEWQPRTAAAMERLFAQAGLTGDFWRVSG
jgi:hypothetical protein